MSQMGKYCKAYPLSALREFEGWTEKPQNDGEEVGASSQNGSASEGEADVSNYVYLQDDYTVTGGIFKDEAIIFDTVSPEWMDFCKNELRFEVSAYATAGS